MKEYEENYPKAWELFLRFWYEFLEMGEVCDLDEWLEEMEYGMPFHTVFGYLVLEFFPEHGIEVERITYYHGGRYISEYHVKTDFHCFDEIKTPEEAIEKAFEILEKRLEAK